MMIYQIDVVDLMSTMLFWFAVIVVVALVIGAVIFFMKVYLITELFGGRRQSVSWRQCPYCGQFTPPESLFCKNCGARLR
jgi:zinc-ribbon domain